MAKKNLTQTSLENVFLNLPSLRAGNPNNMFFPDKQVLQKLFATTDGTTFEGIYARLVTLDSMYSTQMTKRYYGLVELAEALAVIASNLSKQGLTLAEAFKALAQDPVANLHLFDFSKSQLKRFASQNTSKVENLFTASFGIHQKGNLAGRAISLITKYAYYETDFAFPIYDSIVKEIYPRLAKALGIKVLRLSKKDVITSYILAINAMIADLNSLLRLPTPINYDSFDAVLWHIGKIRRKNFSLILTVADYLKCAGTKNIRKSKFYTQPIGKDLVSIAQSI